jgi:hypothetical protein
MKGNEAAHLGRELREMFEATAPEPLPPRLAELLAAIAAKDRQHPAQGWSHLDSFQEGINLRAWLFTILRNCFFPTRGSVEGRWRMPAARRPKAYPSHRLNRAMSTSRTCARRWICPAASARGGRAGWGSRHVLRGGR